MILSTDQGLVVRRFKPGGYGAKVQKLSGDSRK